MGEGLSMNAQQWFEELSDLPRLRIPRCLRTGTGVRSIIHFADASQGAYGAAAYKTSKRGWNYHLSSGCIKIKSHAPSSYQHPSSGTNGCSSRTLTC